MLLDEAVEFVKDQFAKLGPFDGVLAFSQGASFLSLLCAMREGSGLPLETKGIRFDFAVIVSGTRDYLINFIGLCLCGLFVLSFVVCLVFVCLL